MTDETLTGAQALIRTLADCGVTACFANPGTSEMHLVTALDGEPRIRSVLCLFEGVVSGAADGFARMSGTPAMTLLHLGAGYMNAGANIHNARRANTAMINVIGDHAVHHQKYDAPLTSDITGLAGPNSIWIKSADLAARTGLLAAEAFTASLAMGGGPVSLLLPADAAWNENGVVADANERPAPETVTDKAIKDAAAAIKSASKPVLLMNGSALLEGGLEYAGRLEAAGLRMMTDTFVGRQSRGAGRFAPARMQYFAEAAMADLEGTDLMVIAGTQTPVAFFAYPGKPSVLVPEGCKVLSLGGAAIDSADVLARLSDALDAPTSGHKMERSVPDAPSGDLTPSTVGASLSRHMPAGSIISDDGVTAGLPVFLHTLEAEPHDWLMLTGGAIGQGMPLAIGAAIAKPGAKTFCLTGDGAGMYTVQALWTMAREKLDIVTIVIVNHSYRILQIELHRTGAGKPGPAAKSLLNIGQPEIDWVALSKAQGVPATDARTAEAFDDALKGAIEADGPHLIAVHVSG